MSGKVDAALRRLLDVGAALAGLIVLSPILLMVALLVRLSSGKPVLYRARRVGKDGKEFYLLKFRTMRVGADKMGPGITLEGDARITRIGYFLRAHRLDELVQLWNVLVGEMSLVGPRPEDPRYVAHYTQGQRQVLQVRPGVTGPAQIAFRNEAERLRHAPDPVQAYLEEIMPVKLAIDIEYQMRRTVWSDIGVLFNTLRIYVGGRILILGDIVGLLLAYILAFAIRFDNTTYSIADQLSRYWHVFIPVLIIKLVVFERMGLYRRLWRYAGVKELLSIVIAVALGSTLSGALILLLWAWPDAFPLVDGFPRSVIAIDAMLTLLLVGGVRFVSLWRQEMRSKATQLAVAQQGARRVLIAGAGDAGAMTAREMLRNPQLGYDLVGFLDDDPDKQGLHIHGVPVVGALADLARCVSEHQANELLIAMPTARGSVIRRVVELARQVGVPVRTLPGYYELVSGQVSVANARQVRLEDLLRRAPTPIDLADVSAYLTDAVVLVSGAGGSIGSEICRQVAHFGPAGLVLLGHGENSIYQIDLEMRRHFSDVLCVPVLCDIRERTRLDWVLERHRPSVIFHAAAYKHVPMVEWNEEEAVINNVIGTRNLLAAAQAAGVEKLVLISSDKAANPTSVMGATKRLGELMVQRAAWKGHCAYVVVRFGNVLGSRGSIIPLFQDQIAAGGPVTVTHPQVTRYFMTIQEAVRLVLQAGALGSGAETFILDMGEPVRIYDLACDLIRFYDMEPDRDIAIVFTGLRPGEKLHESLYAETERIQPTGHPGIWVATDSSKAPGQELDAAVDELERLARSHQKAELCRLLARITDGKLAER